MRNIFYTLITFISLNAFAAQEQAIPAKDLQAQRHLLAAPKAPVRAADYQTLMDDDQMRLYLAHRNEPSNLSCPQKCCLCARFTGLVLQSCVIGLLTGGFQGAPIRN